MSDIKWNQDYEVLLHDNCDCPHCVVDDFDADSHELTMNNYLDLYFKKRGDGKVRLRETDKWWSYSIERQSSGTSKRQIELCSDVGEIIWLRGDTLGTYKTVLQCKNAGKGILLTEDYVKSRKDINLSELSFCICERKQLNNNHTIGSFFMIPKPLSKPYGRVSLNTSRARSPYYDNFFMFLILIKDYCVNGKCSDDNMTNLFEYTKTFWDMFRGEDGYQNYIKCMCFEPFNNSIEDGLLSSPISWDDKMVNRYFDLLNKGIAKRNTMLYERNIIEKSSL